MNIETIIKRASSDEFSSSLFKALEEMEGKILEICACAGEMRGELEAVVTAGGKRLRPCLAWVCYRACAGSGDIVSLMTMLELMHTASLIHDDFVDASPTRRGIPTISAEKGGLEAMRAGDYLLSAAMERLKVYRGTGINEGLSQTSLDMCLAEFKQQELLGKPRQASMADYYEIIYGKTASLMAQSCRTGALAAGASCETAEIFHDYGRNLGVAFQLRDDLLDWESPVLTGKPKLQDLRDGTVTAPGILACEKGCEELAEIYEKKEKTKKEFDEALRLFRRHGIGAGMRSLIRDYAARAEGALERIPDSEEKKALCLLARTISEVS